MIKIGWIDYNNARLSNNKLLGVELPETRLYRQGTKNPQMKLHEVTRFINDYNEAKKNQYD
ncbi:hypothetical protein [Providencia burhodogranariea]|nr:hypothetical protein [Providencia burhodogranariea]